MLTQLRQVIAAGQSAQMTMEDEQQPSTVGVLQTSARALMIPQIEVGRAATNT